MRTVAKKSRKRRMESVGCSPQQVKDPDYFLNDSIVEAVKFLNYEKWSQMRFLCHRINQLIQSNQSKLQPYIVNRLSVEITGCNRNSIVSFNKPFLLPKSRRKWLEDHGYLRDEIPDIPLKKVFAGLEFTDYWNGLQLKIEARFEEPVEENIISKTGSRLHGRLAKWPKTPWVFNAEFDNNYSFRGPILAHFFRLLHHPDAYFREISMFPPMTDKFCNMSAKSPIRCGEFTLQRLDYGLEHSLKWMKDNVRAHNITLCFNYDPIIPNPDLHTLLSEFLLDASICARDGIKLDWLPHPREFVKTLIEKYKTLEVTKAIPSILIEDLCSHEQEFEQCLKSNLVLQDDPNIENKCSDSCTVETCKVQNRMDRTRKMIVCLRHCTNWLCGDNAYILYIKFQ